MRGSYRVAPALLGVALAVAACGGATGAKDEPGGSETLTIYSGREQEYMEDLFRLFEDDTGVETEVRYGDSAELAATILEEGDASPADVFFSQDAGSLGVVAEAGLFASLDEATLERVQERFRSPEGLWIGTSGRARVAAFNTDAVAPDELPASITGFTDDEWKGRIGFPPTNSSFQAFVAAMIETAGTDATRAFLEGLVDNEPKVYEDNGATVRALAAGEIDVGFVNHYYIYEVAAEDGPIPVENHYFQNGDPGALVNVAGTGIIAGAENARAAESFVDFLTSEKAQTYFKDEIYEYPVVRGIDARPELVPLAQIESPDIALSDLGESLQPALTLMAETGLL